MRHSAPEWVFGEAALAFWGIAIVLWGLAPWIGKSFGTSGPQSQELEAKVLRTMLRQHGDGSPSNVESRAKIGAYVFFGMGAILILTHASAIWRHMQGQ